MPGRDPPAAPRKREPLTSVVARLEDELRVRQQQLVHEAEANALARARIAVLGALSEVLLALQLLSVASPASGRSAAEKLGAGEAAADSLKRLDELVTAARASLATAIDISRPAARGGGSGGGSGGEGDAAASAAAAAAAASGLVSLAAGGADTDGASSSSSTQRAGSEPGGRSAPPGIELIGSCLPASAFATRAVDYFAHQPTREEFIPFWRDLMRRMALLVHQRARDAGAEEEMNEALATASGAFAGLYLSTEWFPDLMAPTRLYNFETGETEAPPPGWWERVAAAMALTPHQVSMLDACEAWSISNHSGLRGECEALAARALAVPEHLLQSPQPLIGGLDRLQLAFRTMVISHMAIGVTAILGPDQLARGYAASHPYLVSWTDIMKHVGRQSRQPGDQPGQSGQPPPPPPGGSGGGAAAAALPPPAPRRA
ncbi:hypothetical protein Rsub_10345 [Raphidocelis subcapitata]|uniref:Uncharacterized protein n=1 Tax=Raphidocelis subcapitata TaxID=307507 RepID=A0A2V0PBC3_9CHLO|nr:hypothetical protein Rsub_10345 [Raphidocelis subcapitata]|eukprot:GBF97158.1 hypothetical protein Rsub_10345 [Raphidocelis subcapitata]